MIEVNAGIRVYVRALHVDRGEGEAPCMNCLRERITVRSMRNRELVMISS